MRERLIQAGKFAAQTVAVGGGLVALLSFFFGDLGEILDRLEPYRIPIIAITVVVLSLVFYSWLAWLYVREIWRGIRAWFRKRRDRRRLKDLTKTIASAKQFLYSRIGRTESSETIGGLFDAIAVSQVDLRKELTDLAIPHPEPVEKPSRSDVFHWAMYLDVLLPLAIKGDIDEARIILGRIVEQEGLRGVGVSSRTAGRAEGRVVGLGYLGILTTRREF